MGSNYLAYFVRGIEQTIFDTTSQTIQWLPHPSEDRRSEQAEIRGFASLIAFDGHTYGAILFALEHTLAEYYTELIQQVPAAGNPQVVIETVSELSNMIAGYAVSQLNDSLGFQLRLLPPVGLRSESVLMSFPRESLSGACFQTNYGKGYLYLSGLHPSRM